MAPFTPRPVEAAGADRGDRLGDVVGRAARVLAGCRKPVRRFFWYGLSTSTPAAGSTQSTEVITIAAIAAITARCDQRTPATNSSAKSAAT